MNVNKLQYLVGYDARWTDARTHVVNEPIYSETPPPVELREEYLGELVMRLWYLLNIEYETGLFIVKVFAHHKAYLHIVCGKHNGSAVVVKVDRNITPYKTLLTTIVQHVLSVNRETSKELKFPLFIEAKYEAWRREQ